MNFGRNFALETSLSKKLGYYEIEHIDDPCQGTIAVNYKEYFECFKIDETNKKHKGLKKGSAGMNYENFEKRINSLRDIESFGQLEKQVQGQQRLTIKEGKMKHDAIEKSKCAPVNVKRLDFSDGIVSLPFSHPYLSELNNFKGQIGQRIENYLLNEKQNLLRMENNAVLKK